MYQLLIRLIHHKLEFIFNKLTDAFHYAFCRFWRLYEYITLISKATMLEPALLYFFIKFNYLSFTGLHNLKCYPQICHHILIGFSFYDYYGFVCNLFMHYSGISAIVRA